VVVLVEHNGEQYWIDATDNSQSGLLGQRGQPEYGAGLVLGKPGEAMIKRKAPTPELPSVSTHDRFYLSSFGGPVDFVTSTTYRGREANRFRSRLDETGKRALGKQYKEYYDGVYGKLSSLDSLHVKEDEKNNVITVTETYRLKEFWDVNKRAEQADFMAYSLSINRQLDDFDEIKRDRKAPVSVNGPAKVAHRIQFFPNIASPERPLEETAFSTVGFSYSDSEYVLGDSFVFDSELVVTTKKMIPGQLKEYKKFYDRVKRNASSGRYFRNLDSKEVKLGEATTALLKELGGLHQ
jgi:hypothetical protein